MPACLPVRFWQQIGAGIFKISPFLLLRAEICSETLLEGLDEFGSDDGVGIVSLMDHTPGQRQFRNKAVFKTYVAKKRGLSDVEFDAYVANLLQHQQAYQARHEKGTIDASKRLNAVLASHDDTDCAQVSTSKSNGVRFAEFPTTVEAARTCRDIGTSVMMGAPNIVRGTSHSGKVSAVELAGLNLLGMVSFDYVPSTLLASAFQLAGIWVDLPRAIACVTHTPAVAAGLTDRRALIVGARGDVIRVGLHQASPFIRGVWETASASLKALCQAGVQQSDPQSAEYCY